MAAAASRKPDVTVTRLAGAWSGSIRGYGKLIPVWCRAALKGHTGGVSVVLADDAIVRDMNRQFRGKNTPTNVLSFPGDDGELGDIVLAYETVRREAHEQHKSVKRHAAHLVVHGCLHLVGHDHMNDREAERMEALEVAILADFGIPDPYTVAA